MALPAAYNVQIPPINDWQRFGFGGFGGGGGGFGGGVGFGGLRWWLCAGFGGRWLWQCGGGSGVDLVVVLVERSSCARGGVGSWSCCEGDRWRR
ncbi:hypothetical protein Q3G72_019586 [Acer saccharum]|nr:hypothetical protein Q3G72_019586 [Acer saccharum]